MFSLAALSLPLLALRRTRERPPAHKCEQECQQESRVKLITEDGREGWACPRVTEPHMVRPLPTSCRDLM